MHEGDGVMGLPEASQRIALALVNHRSVQRLASIRQLGFATANQQTRLQHTLDSLDLLIGILTKLPGLSKNLLEHVVAAVALEDIGRAPFSNSLDVIFDDLPGLDVGKGPIDVHRSILLIRHFEETEHFLSQKGLSVEVICRLLQGHVPWRKGGWLRLLLDGPLDIDRLSYVRGDIAYADGVKYEIRKLVNGIILEENGEQNTIDSGAIESSVDFLFRRIQLYQDIYFDPRKLAMEHICRLFMTKLWNFVEAKDEQWDDARKPRSIEDFLTWTDDKVISAFEGNRWEGVPLELLGLRNVIRSGELQVSELRQLETEIVDLNSINLALTPAKNQLNKRSHCWVLETEDLPTMRIYESGSIHVRHKGKYQLLEKNSHDVQMLMKRRRRCPIIIFPTDDFATIQKIVIDAKLCLSKVMPLNWVRPSSSH